MAPEGKFLSAVEFESPRGPAGFAGFVMAITRAFEWMLRVAFALTPLLSILYLRAVTDPALRYVDHGFHEIAIAVAIGLSAFVSYVTWRCYFSSGEPLLRWVAQGLTGFTLVYLPHGALTRMADHNMWLFLLYGPVSRDLMAICLFIGLLHYGKPAATPHDRRSLAPVWHGLTLFIAIDVAVAVVAESPIAAQPWLRLVTESAALLLCLLGIGIILWRRIASPLMLIYALALALFAQSSLAFILGKPWNHLWWLAHAIFAGGFLVLSYGILRAFHTTRTLSGVYSQEAMMRQLEHANRELERLAAYDALTGAACRRHFFLCADAEVARAARNGEAVSLLMFDLDHFKRINDTFGHQAGDTVLTAVVAHARELLRRPDLIGRLGGEEFVVLLPQSNAAEAAIVGERIREAVQKLRIRFDGQTICITLSMGVAEFGSDGADIEQVIGAADKRMYAAKAAGRNRVIAV
jgi:two-component system cell cycle response regulator